MSAGGVVRVATKQVSATKEIFYGMALGIVAGMGWRGWHTAYKAQIDDYYVKLAANTEADAKK